MSVDTEKSLSSGYGQRAEAGESMGLAGRLVELRETLAEGAGLSWAEAGRGVAGLVTVWLAGSGYGLLKRGVDPFGELLTLHARLSGTNGWLPPPDLGGAVVELLTKFQPSAMGERPWQLSPSVGLAVCRQLHGLHGVEPSVKDGPRLFAAWLGVADPDGASWPNEAGHFAPDETPFWVDDGWNGADLVEAFARRVAYYQTYNAETLRPARPDEEGQLTMFDSAEEVVVEATPVVEDIPGRALDDFRAVPGLHPERRLAASLTLWQAALEAYAVGRVSIFNSLPLWELR